MTESVSQVSHRLSVAPMMDWTDRHCRFFHRRFTREALLYTEMVTTGAVLHGSRERLLAFHPEERPVALQLGGSDPRALAEAARIGRAFGYDEINLNVGCPSDRVQSGCFGAALMREPARVAECVAAMVAVIGAEAISVKCRIGVDAQDPALALPALLEAVAATGVRRFAVHARKAWLDGLSPRENRTVPPLDHDLVMRVKAAFPELAIVLNGGVTSLGQAAALLARGVDGVMMGRAAYQTPAVLGAADRVMFGCAGGDIAAEDAVRAMLPYIEVERGLGTPLGRITRHMLGAFQGRPGARGWRRMLSEEAHRAGAGPDLVERALALVAEPAPVGA